MIRIATRKDLAVINRVARAAYPEYIFNLYVKDEIMLSFIKSPYDITTFVYEHDNNIVAFGCIARSMFMYNVFELRMACTHPRYTKKGFYKEMIQFRIDYIKGLLRGHKGVIQVSTNMDENYKDFEKIFTNSLGYNLLQLKVN